MSLPIRSIAGRRLIDPPATIGSIAVKGGGATGVSVAPELDLLDLGLGRRQPRLALLLEAVAFAIKFDRFVERRLAALELADDLFELLSGASSP